MIRIFVGCDPNHCDLESQAVLEWSIRKHASAPVDITWMQLSRNPASPYSGWNTSAWATSFSGLRWSIPAVCGFQGRAIYMDSDVIVMADIKELWEQPLAPGKVALAKGGGSWRYCVSLWDCAEAKKHFPPLSHLKSQQLSHHEMMRYFSRNPHLTQAFDGDWNCLDGAGHIDLKDGKLKALHYTSISTQPHLKYALPRLAAQGRKHWFNGNVRPHPRADVQRLFDHLLKEAIDNGYSPDKYANTAPYGDFRKASLKNYRGIAA